MDASNYRRLKAGERSATVRSALILLSSTGLGGHWPCFAAACLSCGRCSPVVLGQSGEVIGEIGETDLCPRPDDADGANDEAEAVLLGSEDVLDV